MFSRCISNEISDKHCGFESATERYLLSKIIADGFQQFRTVKDLFDPVMRASKLLNIHYSAVPIYGAGPRIFTYGDLIQQATTLDFVIRYKLGNAVDGVFDRDGWKVKNS